MRSEREGKSDGEARRGWRKRPVELVVLELGISCESNIERSCESFEREDGATG